MRRRLDDTVRLVRIEGFDAEAELSHLTSAGRRAARYVLTHLAASDWCKAADADGFRPMNAQLMRSLLGSASYDSARSALLRAGHIQVYQRDGRESYEVGIESKRYRLSDELRFRPKEFPHVPAPQLRRKLKREFRRVRHPAHRWLLDQFRHVAVAPGWRAEFDRGDTPDPAAAGQRLVLGHLEDGTGWGRVDDFGLRLHTPFGGLRRDLRKFVRLCGEPLWEIDIANSQPLFLGLDLLARHVAGGTLEDAAAGRRRLADPYAREDRLSQLIREEADGGSAARGRCDLPADAAEYLDVCAAGRWYAHLAELLGRNPVAERSEVKLACMRWLFGGAGEEVRQVRSAVRRRHPTVERHVSDCRKRGRKFLAMRLQRTEAAFVFRRVVGGWIEHDPGRPLLTLHDGFFCRERDVEAVVTAVRSRLGAIGLPAPLKIGPA